MNVLRASPPPARDRRPRAQAPRPGRDPGAVQLARGGDVRRRWWSRPPPRSRPRRSPSSRSTTGSRSTTPARWTDRRRVRGLGDRCTASRPTSQTYLVGWVGQRALQDLRVKLFAHLQSLSIGFYSRNRAGVIISRLTNDVEALDQLVSDGLATLIQSGLTLIGVVVILFVYDAHLALLTLPRAAAAAGGRDRVPDRVGRRLPADAREDRLDHRLPAGVAVGDPRRALVRPGARRTSSGSRELNDENRAANMTTVYLNAAYFPAVELLSALVTVEILVIGGIEVDQRARLDRGRVRCSSPRSTTSSTRSSSCRSCTRPTSRAWRRSTRSSGCSTSGPSSSTLPTRSQLPPDRRRAAVRGRVVPIRL